MQKAKFWIAGVGALALVAATGLMGQTKTVQSPIEVELVFANDTGFYPQSIERGSGKFLLIVINRSSVSATTIRIATQGLAAVAPTISTTAKSQDFTLDLSPGTYLLSDSSHPTWSPVTIVIKP